MPHCLFCLTQHDDVTDEHVFMAAIGGKLVVKGSCVQCNNALNKAFEEKMVRRLADFRRVLRIPGRRGEFPTIDTKIEVNGKEMDGKLLSDGSIRLRPLPPTKRVRDGVEETVYEHVNDKQKEELRRHAREKGLELIEETTPGVEVQGYFSGDLDFIDSAEMLRTAAKTAYTALALRMGLDFAMGDTFNDLRAYILTGTGSPNPKLFLNADFLAACAQGPHQHSVVLVGRNDKHRVDAIVRFFGGLCYFVNLAEGYAGADFFDTLVYDAQRGETNKTLVVHEQAEFLQMDEVCGSKETVWNDKVQSGEWFVKFLDEAVSAKPSS